MIEVYAGDEGGVAAAGGGVGGAGDDDRLVALVLAGDRAAFADIVARHRGPIYRRARHILGDAEDAEDATQEAFVRAYLHLARYRPGSSLRAWLLAIAGNGCVDQLRRRRVRHRRTVPLDLLGECAGPGEATPEAHFLEAEWRTDLWHRVGTLPGHYRQVLALRYEHGLTYAEIGLAIARPVSTVRMRLLRARRCLALANATTPPAPVGPRDAG